MTVLLAEKPGEPRYIVCDTCGARAEFTALLPRTWHFVFASWNDACPACYVPPPVPVYVRAPYSEGTDFTCCGGDINGGIQHHRHSCPLLWEERHA